jgi:hypothetical protein
MSEEKKSGLGTTIDLDGKIGKGQVQLGVRLNKNFCMVL